MRQHGVLTAVINLAMRSELPGPVKTEAMKALADLIRGNAANQEALGSSIATATQEDKLVYRQPAVVYLISVVATRGSDFSLRGAATYLFQCFLHKNPVAQVAIASTLISPPAANEFDGSCDLCHYSSQ